MNQIPSCDWLPEWARWSYLANSGFLAWSRQIKGHFFGILSNIINPFFTKREVKVAGNWPRSFFACLRTSTTSS